MDSVTATATAARSTSTDEREVRVGSIPSGHVYVQHLAVPGECVDGRVVRLPDPRPDGAGPASPWWPPAVLEPAWIEEHAHEIDLVHLHFGFDAADPERLRRWVGALRAAGLPLVQTVHDLRNPHHRDATIHDAQLDVLVPVADALVTLTDGAAREIRERWGRDALVLPHPHVVPLDVAEEVQARRRLEPRSGVVGLHLKSLRAGMAPLPVLAALREAVATLPGATLRIDGHRDVLEPDGARFDPVVADAVRRAAVEDDHVEVHVHDFFTDDALWAYLADLDVSVLPYRHGTHSGWLEACLDLGTAVVAPSCGFYADQGPVQSYRLDADGFDADSLVTAVQRAWTERPAPVRTPDERLRQRVEVASAHEVLYRRVLGR